VCKINDPVRAQGYATLGVNTVDRTTMMIDSIGRFMGRTGIPGARDVTTATPGPSLPDRAEAESARAGGEGTGGR
jgi:hypothetical protein